MPLKTCWLIALSCLMAPNISARQQRPSEEVRFPTASARYAQAKFDIQPIPSEANTWGFTI